MGVVDMSVTMRPATHMGLGAGGEIGLLLTPVAHRDIPGMDPEDTWVWAVVQRSPGIADKFLVGGTATSQTAAAAIGHHEFAKIEAEYLARKAGS